VVRQAKAEGRTEAKLPTPVITPTGVQTIDDVVRNYSVLRVVVIDKVTGDDKTDIQTWYKLKIVETIHPQLSISEESLPPGVPTRLLPVNASETIYVMTGGESAIDGVTVVQHPAEKGLALQNNKEYVGIFFLEYGGRLATPAAASAAIFEVQNDDLKPQGDEDNELVKNIRFLFKSRLSSLRSEVRRQASLLQTNVK
jgi:hypothetical protein